MKYAKYIQGTAEKLRLSNIFKDFVSNIYIHGVMYLQIVPS